MRTLAADAGAAFPRSRPRQRRSTSLARLTLGPDGVRRVVASSPRATGDARRCRRAARGRRPAVDRRRGHRRGPACTTTSAAAARPAADLSLRAPAPHRSSRPARVARDRRHRRGAALGQRRRLVLRADLDARRRRASPRNETAPGRWLVLADAGELADALVAALRSGGGEPSSSSAASVRARGAEPLPRAHRDVATTWPRCWPRHAPANGRCTCGACRPARERRCRPSTAYRQRWSRWPRRGRLRSPTPRCGCCVSPSARESVLDEPVRHPRGRAGARARCWCCRTECPA